ncbi:unnamed protein product [Phytophthora lilii]|uniref:Unnamed protein product n=1 Tax=Phytophthora lilii TaxID=2077276 RepID=A0A9W6TB97_9STRA|nr:unnamed protein product [Phytophthora lilii]
MEPRAERIGATFAAAKCRGSETVRTGPTGRSGCTLLRTRWSTQTRSRPRVNAAKTASHLSARPGRILTLQSRHLPLCGLYAAPPRQNVVPEPLIYSSTTQSSATSEWYHYRGTYLPIQVSQLPAHPAAAPSTSPSKAVNPTASATGSLGFKLSLLTPRKPPLHCCLVFRNFYVAWLRIVQVNVDGSSTELATAYPLMQHLHCEDDGQNWQLVKLDQLPVSWNPHVFDSLCVYLSQPSPLWETWELRDVKFRVLPQENENAVDTIASTRLRSVSPPRLEKAASLRRNGSAAEDRLTQLLERRTSRSTLTLGGVGAESSANPVEEHATRCLDLVLRLRELLQR